MTADHDHASAPAHAQTPAEAEALLFELQELFGRLPLPQQSWHAYVPEIRACHADFARALEIAAGSRPVLAVMATLLESESEPLPTASAPPVLAAATARLRTLPLPEGQHPFLDEIMPALEAARLLLVAIGSVPEAAAAF